MKYYLRIEDQDHFDTVEFSCAIVAGDEFVHHDTVWRVVKRRIFRQPNMRLTCAYLSVEKVAVVGPAFVNVSLANRNGDWLATESWEVPKNATHPREMKNSKGNYAKPGRSFTKSAVRYIWVMANDVFLTHTNGFMIDLDDEDEL